MNTILHNGDVGITRMLSYDEESGITLEDWKAGGLYEMTLSPSAVQALLQQLPIDVLQASLAARSFRIFSMCACTAEPDVHIALSGNCGASLADDPAPLVPKSVELWHWTLRPAQAACGADVPNQATTTDSANVTCSACRHRSDYQRSFQRLSQRGGV